MTATAVRAKLAIMYVIGAVAVAAGVANTLHGSQRTTVTVVAGNLDVGTT